MPAAAVEQIGKIIGQDATSIPRIAILGFRFSDASGEVLTMTRPLIAAYEEYIELLTEAEAALMSFAYVHGWRCPEDLVERGKQCRAKIAELKAADAEIAGDHNGPAG